MKMTVLCFCFFLAPILISCVCSKLDRSNEVFNIRSDDDYGRIARLALVQLEMLVPQNPERHISDAFAAIDTAGKRGVDLIVLPEGVNIGSGSKIPYKKIAISVDSPLLRKAAEKAEEYHCYIVFPFIEQAGSRVYNSAALFGRDGSRLGVYRKVHEPRCIVLNEKVSLGREFPVFDTDIGRIGILICYDTITPEPAMIYGLQGVDLIVYPHMIQPLENEYFHITTRAKAFDASLYIGAAGWARPFEKAGGPLSATCLIDPEAKILAQASKTDPGIIYHKVRLCRPRITDGLGVEKKAEWRKVLWGERRPDLYRKLLESNAAWRAWCPPDER